MFCKYTEMYVAFQVSWNRRQSPYLAVKPVEANDAVGVAVLGYISLSRQRRVTVPTAEVFDVPRLLFRLGVLSGENYLKYRTARWFRGTKGTRNAFSIVHVILASRQN